MSKLDWRMKELRQLRNSAKGLVREDVAYLTGDRGAKAAAPRLMDSARDKARAAKDHSVQYASEHKFRIGAGLAIAIGVFLAWIFRHRIEKAFDQLLDHINGEEEPDAALDYAADADSEYDENGKLNGAHHDRADHRRSPRPD